MLYLDSSALVKCYVDEAGALDTMDLIDGADLVATSTVSRVEVSSALARAVREGVVAAPAGRHAHRAFTGESAAIIQVPLTERLIVRAQQLVWDHGLRGYDAVQLASALTWQERVGSPITLATFDTRLAHAARAIGVATWPSPT